MRGGSSPRAQERAGTTQLVVQCSLTRTNGRGLAHRMRYTTSTSNVAAFGKCLHVSEPENPNFPPCSFCLLCKLSKSKGPRTDPMRSETKRACGNESGYSRIRDFFRNSVNEKSTNKQVAAPNVAS